MKSFFLRLVLYALAFYAAAYIFKGVYTAGPWPALWMAIAFTFLNQWVKPVLSFIALPVTCLTLGIFQLMINMFVLWLADWLVDGFRIHGTLTILILTFVLIAFNGFISLIIPNED